MESCGGVKAWTPLVEMCLTADAYISTIPFLMARIINIGIANSDTSYITTTGLAMIGIALFSLLFGACGPSGPEPIEVHKDLCHHCKMNIADTRFAAELITGKGRVYKFDDVLCLQAYVSDLVADPKAEVYICDYADPGHLTPLDSLVFVQGDAIQSPMRGNIAAFRDEKQLQEYNEVWKGIQIDRGIIFAQ